MPCIYRKRGEYDDFYEGDLFDLHLVQWILRNWQIVAVWQSQIMSKNILWDKESKQEKRTIGYQAY